MTPASIPATIPAQICPADLPDRVNQIINAPAFDRARWGILVQTLNPEPSQRETLVERDRQKLFIPASNTKLLTTAAALIALGPQYRIRTSIFGQVATAGWNLQLIGNHDPSLKDPQLTQLAQQLKQQGITQIAQLTLPDGQRPTGGHRDFGSDRTNDNWTWGDLQSDYGAIAHRLTLNLNSHTLTATPQSLGQPLKLDWSNPSAIAGLTINNQTQTVGPTAPEFLTVSRDLGSPTLHVRGQRHTGGTADTIDLAVLNPTQVFRDRLQTALQTANITVNQITIAPATNTFPQAVAFVESPTLEALVYETNQESDNLYAEALLQTIGTEAQRHNPNAFTPEDNPTTAGLKTLAQTLEKIGVDRSGYAIVDGSGLARLNLVSPTAFVQTLQAMATQPTRQAYQTSLPIAAQSGTLTNRFRNTAATGIVQAKTGTLTGVASLSGYIQPKNYPPIAFSILLNQSTLTSTQQREAIDAIVLLLTQLKPC
jgi:serine-type D-Ala-D-Ala carboxypeptidase/endopeptidase (penicillin-binding protein 4)